MILQDESGARFKVDRAGGFMVTVDRLNAAGNPAGIESFSVDPFDKSRYRKVFVSKQEAPPASSPAEPAPLSQPNPAEAQKPRPALKQRIEQAEAERAGYYTPGSIVKSYGGHDRVVRYTPGTESAGWSVTVEAVVKQGDEWVPDPKDNRTRKHSTQPEARNLADGPVQRAPVAEAPAEPAPLSQPNPAEAPDVFALTPDQITALEGKTIDITVAVGDSGNTATMTLDAAAAVRDIQTRHAAARKMMECFK